MTEIARNLEFFVLCYVFETSQHLLTLMFGSKTEAYNAKTDLFGKITLMFTYY